MTNNVEEELKELTEDFAQVNTMISEMNLENLPFALKFAMMNEYVKLTKAMKEFNRETKKIIVMAAMLNR